MIIILTFEHNPMMEIVRFIREFLIGLISIYGLLWMNALFGGSLGTSLAGLASCNWIRGGCRLFITFYC